MRLEELYPYWGYAHQQLLDLVEFLTEAQLEARPHPDARSIREICLHLVREERFWIGHLIAGYAPYVPVQAEHPDAAALVESLSVTREVTRRVVEPLSPEGLRAVRTVPADPAVNRPETNMPISRLIWQVVEHELYGWGQIAQRFEDGRQLRPRGRADRN